MAMTTAQRQAQFRKRKTEAGNGARRLDMLLDTRTHQALKRIALHGDESMGAVIARLILAEDARISASLTDSEFDDYIDRALPGNDSKPRTRRE
jgi:hypothetical protein